MLGPAQPQLVLFNDNQIMTNSWRAFDNFIIFQFVWPNLEDFNKSLHYIVELGTLITGRYPLASHIVCSNSVKLSPLLSASTSLPIFTNLSNHILTNLATRQVLSKLLPRVMSYTSTGVHSLQFCTLHSSTSLGAAELLWSLSGLLYRTYYVSWHVHYHFKVSKKERK